MQAEIIVASDDLYYDYTLSYPDDYPDPQLAGTIFYVGKGRMERIHDHEKQAERKVSCNARKIAIIQSIWDYGLDVKKDKVAFWEDEMDAYMYEWALMNMTAYAENLTNIKHDAVRKLRAGVAQPNRKNKLRVQACEALKNYRIRAGWSVQRLASEAKIALRTARKAEDGYPVHAATAKTIADALSRALQREIKPGQIEGLNIK